MKKVVVSILDADVLNGNSPKKILTKLKNPNTKLKREEWSVIDSKQVSDGISLV